MMYIPREGAEGSRPVGLTAEGVCWELLSQKRSKYMSVLKWTSFPGKGIGHEGMRRKTT